MHWHPRYKILINFHVNPIFHYVRSPRYVKMEGKAVHATAIPEARTKFNYVTNMPKGMLLCCWHGLHRIRVPFRVSLFYSLKAQVDLNVLRIRSAHEIENNIRGVWWLVVDSIASTIDIDIKGSNWKRLQSW